MNATARTSIVAGTTIGKASRATAALYAMRVGNATCPVRARTIAAIADLIGFEQELEESVVDLPAAGPGGSVMVDLLDSRMIAPPRPLRRRQRPVSSRAVFYGIGG